MQLNDIVWKPRNIGAYRECDIHPHAPIEKADLFSAADGGSTEYEFLNWIHSCIRFLKPKLILETGGFQGLGTVAMAHACKLNGFGKVITLENMPNLCVGIESLVEENNLSNYASVQCFDSLQYLQQTNEVFEMGFFDSETTIRARECEILFNKNAIKNLAVFHDTSPYRTEDYTPKHVQETYRNQVFNLAKHPSCTGFYDCKLSRGFMALWLNSH